MWAAFAYDAVFLYAHAFKEMITAGLKGLDNGEVVWEYLHAVYRDSGGDVVCSREW